MLEGVKGYLPLRLGRISVGGEERVCTRRQQGIAQRPRGTSGGGIV